MEQTGQSWVDLSFSTRLVMMIIFMAGSFSGARILNAGAGYVAGDICIQGNTHGGSGFNGTYSVDALNGSLSSISIIQHGVNYTKDPSLFGLCFPGSTTLQVISF